MGGTDLEMLSHYPLTYDLTAHFVRPKFFLTKRREGEFRNDYKLNEVARKFYLSNPNFFKRDLIAPGFLWNISDNSEVDLPS